MMDSMGALQRITKIFDAFSNTEFNFSSYLLDQPAPRRFFRCDTSSLGYACPFSPTFVLGFDFLAAI